MRKLMIVFVAVLVCAADVKGEPHVVIVTIDGFAAYNMSKAALVSLTQTVAKEARGTGVRVYSVSPAGVNTEMRQKAHGDAEMQMSRDVVAQVIVDLTTPNAPESGSDIVVSKKGVEVHPMEEWYE